MNNFNEQNVKKANNILKLMSFEKINNGRYIDIISDDNIIVARIDTIEWMIYKVKCNGVQIRVKYREAKQENHYRIMLGNKMYAVHVVIAVATNKYDGMSFEDIVATNIDHIDGDGSNNNPDNLEVVTFKENTARYYRSDKYRERRRLCLG